MTEFDVKAQKRTKPRPASPVIAAVVKFRPRLWAAAAITGFCLIVGTPHLLVTYECIGRCTSSRARYCNYIGIHGWVPDVKPVRDGCPLIRLL